VRAVKKEIVAIVVKMDFVHKVSTIPVIEWGRYKCNRGWKLKFKYIVNLYNSLCFGSTLLGQDANHRYFGGGV